MPAPGDCGGLSLVLAELSSIGFSPKKKVAVGTDANVRLWRSSPLGCHPPMSAFGPKPGIRSVMSGFASCNDRFRRKQTNRLDGLLDEVEGVSALRCEFAGLSRAIISPAPDDRFLSLKRTTLSRQRTGKF